MPRFALAAVVLIAGGRFSHASTLSPSPTADRHAAPAAPTVVPPSAETLTQLARSSNAFGFDLYRRLRLQPGNLIVSPASLSLALGMTWGGAQGETAEEMRRVLHLVGTPDAVRTASGQLARSLQDPARPVTFRIANQLFAEKTYELRKDFVATTRAAYGAPLERVDFARAAEPSRVRINGWVAEKTEKRIKDLIPPRGVNAGTRLVLANAIYFLGDWAVPFTKEATLPAPFHLSASQTADVPTMNRVGSFRIASRDGVTAVELPYKGDAMSMILLVPEAVDGLAALEAGLDAGRFEALSAALDPEQVWVALPKLKLEPSASLALSEDLKALGMPLAFDLGQADFRGIADPPNSADRLAISEVFHKGFIKVDEKGTEAAAATAVVMMETGSALAPPVRVLKVDRPFLFLIRDKASGLIVFLGRVSDPRAR